MSDPSKAPTPPPIGVNPGDASSAPPVPVGVPQAAHPVIDARPPPPISLGQYAPAYEAAMAASRGITVTADSALARQRSAVDDVVKRFELDPDFARDLPILAHYHLAFIIDDSGSMGARTNANERRWDELQRTFNAFLDLASSFASGADADLLNVGQSYLDIDPARLRALFTEHGPDGLTPLVGKLRMVLTRAKDRLAQTGKPTCIVVGTDGEPSDGSVRDLIGMLNDTSLRTPDKCPVMFLACTDELASVAYLNEIDRAVKCVDVCDDFKSEQKEVRDASGRQLTYGDYILKCLLGTVLPKYDMMDEGPMHICVVCGTDATYEPAKGTQSRNGWKCGNCTTKKALVAPPYCMCAKCQTMNSELVYTRTAKGWMCSNCEKDSGCCGS